MKSHSQSDSIKICGFGKWLSHEAGVLMNWSHALWERTSESSLASSSLWGHNEPRSELSPDTEPAGALISDFSASRAVRNECLLCKAPVYGTLL